MATIKQKERSIMTTLTTTNDSLLYNALRADSLFSGLSGIVITFGAGAVADFMGAGNPVSFIVIGIALVLYAAFLLLNSANRPVSKNFGWLIVAGNVVWVIGSAIILLTDVFALSAGGRWAVLIVADFVLLFAIAQYLGIRRMN